MSSLRLAILASMREAGITSPQQAPSASPPRKRMPCWLPLGRARPACYAFLTMSGGR